MSLPRKVSSSLNLKPEEEKGNMNPITSKSCESLYSHCSKGTANIPYRSKRSANFNNKQTVARQPGVRQPSVIPATTEVRQRVLSARRLRMKTYQNQLADAQQTIAELAHENRMLRTLHKRQDSALSKYESTNAELPQLLHSHAEELRVWQTKYRNLQATNKELEQKLKQKEAVILTLSDQNKHFIQLNKDKSLEDRQRLTEKLQTLEARLQEKDNDIKLMARKMQLQAKLSKQQLQAEQKKHKELLMKLEKTRLELSGYRKLEELQLQEDFNIHTRRNKGSHNDSTKVEKETEKYKSANINEAETTDDTEALNSQRSNHSATTVERTTRSMKNSTTKTHLTVSSSTIVIQQQVSKQPTPRNKSIAVLRRVDQGDGDGAFNMHDACKNSNSFRAQLMQRQHSNLSSITQNRQDKFDDYEDDVDFDNDDLDVDELEENKESQENEIDNPYDDNNVDGDYVSNIDSPNDEIDNDDYNDDYFKESLKIDTHLPGDKIRMKEEISSIRKQITDDFKEREAFLDTFCRQASNAVVADETLKKRNSVAVERNVSSGRKNKLLSALKAIDDKKNQD